MLKTGQLCMALALGGSALAAQTPAAPASQAGSTEELCRAASEAKIGQWASYDVSGGQADGSKLKFAIVGSERRGDTTLYWLEIAGSSLQNPARNGIVQMLVPGPGARATSIHGMIVKVGSQPAMKMSAQMLGMMGSRLAQDNMAMEFARQCATGRVVGPETVTVPAGSIPAIHVKSADGGDAWLAKDVPFGLVKAVGKQGTLVLTGHGSDAKSSITETPQEMPIIPGMPKP
jgi:hypothetical protein